MEKADVEIFRPISIDNKNKAKGRREVSEKATSTPVSYFETERKELMIMLDLE